MQADVYAPVSPMILPQLGVVAENCVILGQCCHVHASSFTTHTAPYAVCVVPIAYLGGIIDDEMFTKCCVFGVKVANSAQTRNNKNKDAQNG